MATFLSMEGSELPSRIYCGSAAAQRPRSGARGRNEMVGITYASHEHRRARNTGGRGAVVLVEARCVLPSLLRSRAAMLGGRHDVAKTGCRCTLVSRV